MSSRRDPSPWGPEERNAQGRNESSTALALTSQRSSSKSSSRNERVGIRGQRFLRTYRVTGPRLTALCILPY